jgi:mono/diheme cytochrome c family protein
VKITALTFLLAVCGIAYAETPRQIVGIYAAEAAAQTSGFRPSAQRGEAFFAQKFGVSEKMPACAACHTEDPRRPGRHAVTGKEIKPMASVANAERFTDPAKVEKWFRRNCKEVVGRDCTPAEKADFVLFAAESR